MMLPILPGGMGELSPVIRPLADAGTAHLLAGALANQPYPFFLDSGMREGSLGRFSFVGCDPFLILRSHGRRVELVDSFSRRRMDADPFQVLETLLAGYAVPKGDYPVPFIGGAVGYLAYDLGRLIEKLPHKRDDFPSLPESHLCFYDVVVGFDHDRGQAYLCSNGLPEPPGKRRSNRAERRLAWMAGLLEEAASSPVSPLAKGSETSGAPGWRPGPSVAGRRAGKISCNFTREEYLRTVRRARDYIIAGDIYQVNLSQRFQAPWEGAPWDLYRRLREVNAAPFAAYQDFGDLAVASASPERFLRLTDDVIETRPIKGTRPRGRTANEDQRLARELEASVKDRAEHIMIVDLERNDLGRVSHVGTVTVDELMTLESYATVHHLTSTIRGRLRRDRGLRDLLRATFPGGSITGAPKIRAMEIIDELEPTRRGIYTGAIGYFSATGDLDLNIAIRTIVLQDGIATFQVGGGIVFDSDPAEEYQETLDKGRALLQALGRE